MGGCTFLSCSFSSQNYIFIIYMFYFDVINCNMWKVLKMLECFEFLSSNHEVLFKTPIKYKECVSFGRNVL